MRTWIGVDIGTSGVKVIAIDEDAQLVATRTRTYPLSSPEPGWVEQRPEDWWNATVEAIHDLLTEVPGEQVAGVGLTGQMHGLVAIDEDDRVLRDAILWNDNRNGAECEEILELVGGLDGLLRMTNNNALPGYTFGKILWLRRHDPELFAAVDVVLNPKDFLRLRMTGKRFTDVSDASGTGLLDVRARAWSTELFDILGLRHDLLPPVVESSDLTGAITPEAAELLGIPSGTPVVGGGGDSVLQTTSMGIAAPGTLGITLGTGGIVGAAADHCPTNDGRLQVSCGNAPGLWHIMGVALSVGGAFQWWRQALGPLGGAIPANEELSRLAASAPPGARGLSFVPYLVGERCPYIAPDARGSWVGLDLRHDVTDMTRALVEGALLNLRMIRDIVDEIGLATDDVRLSGGASTHEIWSECLADILGTPAWFVTGSEQGAAYGAALLAGIGTGQWPDLITALASVRTTSQVTPRAENTAVYDRAFDQWRRIHPALASIAIEGES